MGVDVDYTPAVVNIAGVCNDQFTDTIYFRDASGSVVDMTGTYTAYLRTNKQDSLYAGTFVCTTTNITTGTLVITAGTTTTGALCTGAMTRWDGYWDLRRNQGSGVVRTLLAGTARFDLNVTR